MESNNFDFQCTKYVDFEKECLSDNDTVSDVFFDCSGSQKKSTPLDFSDIDTPAKEEFKVPTKMRRSLSVGNMVMFGEETKKETYMEGYYKSELQNVSENHEDISAEIQKMSLSLGGESNKLEKKGICGYESENDQMKKGKLANIKKGDSHGNLSRLTHHKSHRSVEDLKGQPKKFVSMAEAISKFQTQTPTRFRSKPSLLQNNDKGLTRTIPQSPALQTKARSRPTVNILTHEEKEVRQFEELQKCKIRANPVNKKILQGPLKPVHPPEKKATTVVKPFNLTKPQPKRTEPSAEKFQFHAQPIYTGDDQPKKTQTSAIHRQPTKPITPSFMKNYKRMPARMAEEPKNCGNKTCWKNEQTKPVPFSFEMRDKMVLEKRKKFLQKLEEEERKAREFVARGVPKYIQNKNRSSKSESGSSACSSRRNILASQENLTAQFKARPPTVLFIEPFVPARSNAPLTEAKPFKLESEIRAMERLEFQRELELKEEHMEYLRRVQEEEKKRLEEEERKKIRRECEQFKAQPVRKFRPIIIQPSGKITEPKSPTFCHRMLHRENKENVVDNNQ